jgi:YHS domain-containing protein
MKIKIFFLILLVFSKSFGQNKTSPVGETELRKKHFWQTKPAIAYDGYDVTSYFSGKPKKGKKEFAANLKGIVYLFENEKNKALYLANPEKYEPAYGGWCAYAIGAKGEKVEPDPENFKIVNGKVNLFYKNFFSNTLDDWNADEKNLKAKADQNWVSKIYK